MKLWKECSSKIATSSVKRLSIGKAIFLAAVIFATDIATKELTFGQGYGISVLNHGSARSLPFPVRGAIIVALLMCCILLVIFVKSHITVLSFSLLIGGILGNLYDRIFLGGVRDWIAMQDIVPLGESGKVASIQLLHHWVGSFPIFNIADCCIVAGGILLLWKEISSSTAR